MAFACFRWSSESGGWVRQATGKAVVARVAAAWLMLMMSIAPALARADVPTAAAGTPTTKDSPAAQPADGTPAPPPEQPATTPPVEEEPRLGFDAADMQRPSMGAAEELSGIWAVMVKTVVALAAVLLLAYLLLGKGLARFAQRQTEGRSLRVVERVALDNRKSLYLVEVDGARALVAMTDNAVGMMTIPDDAPVTGSGIARAEPARSSANASAADLANRPQEPE